jgi:hypothetical protein
MNAMTFTTAVGAALAAASFALAAPALASTDGMASDDDSAASTSLPGASTSDPLADAPRTPGQVAQDIARSEQIREAIRRGAANSTASAFESRGSGLASITSLPDFPDFPDFLDFPDDPRGLITLPAAP